MNALFSHDDAGLGVRANNEECYWRMATINLDVWFVEVPIAFKNVWGQNWENWR